MLILALLTERVSHPSSCTFQVQPKYLCGKEGRWSSVHVAKRATRNCFWVLVVGTDVKNNLHFYKDIRGLFSHTAAQSLPGQFKLDRIPSAELPFARRPTAPPEMHFSIQLTWILTATSVLGKLPNSGTPMDDSATSLCGIGVRPGHPWSLQREAACVPQVGDTVFLG